MAEVNEPTTDVRAVVLEHFAAFNAHDTERVLRGFAEDAVWVTGQDTMRGAAALRDVFDPWLWSTRPSLTVHSLIVDGLLAAAQCREVLTLDETLHSFEIAVFFRVRDGLLVSGKVYREGSADLGS